MWDLGLTKRVVVWPEGTGGHVRMTSLACYKNRPSFFFVSFTKRSPVLLVCVLESISCLFLDCSLQHSTHDCSIVNLKKPKGPEATAAWPSVCWTGCKCCTAPGLNSGFTRKLSMICCLPLAVSRCCVCYSTCSSCSWCAFYAFV